MDPSTVSTGADVLGVLVNPGAKYKPWKTAAKAVLGYREIAVGDYFGRQSFASPVGMMTLFHGAGAVISRAVLGRIFH